MVKIEILVEERFENAIKHQPERYIVLRDKNDKIYEFHDTDSGVVWIKTKEGGWIWVA